MKRIWHLIAGFLLLLVAGASPAQDYPSKALTLIIPFAAGGPSDVVGRAAARVLARQLNQSVVVENRAGATGLIGLEAFERSQPDGYTLLMFADTTAITLAAQGKPFEITKRMTPLANIYTALMLASVNPKMIDARTLPELVDYLRAHPGTFYTSSGNGSSAHIYTEAWAAKQGIKLAHVAYKGVAPALTDVLGGRVPMIIADGTATKTHILSGALRPIAAVSGGRLDFIADVRTSAEQGHPDFDVQVRSGLAVTAGTPEPIVARLRQAVRDTVLSEEYRKVVTDSGANPQYVDGPGWGAMMQRAYDSSGRIIREAGIKIDN